MEPETKNRVMELLSGQIGWNHLCRLASENRVKQLLYWQLRHIPETVPEEVMGHLKNNFQENTGKNLLLWAEMRKVMKILQSANIMVVPHKGPVLAISTYGGIEFRHFSDLDLMINKRDLKKTRITMISKGYKLSQKTPEDLNLKFMNEYKFVNDVKGIDVEIHWNICWKSFHFSKGIEDPFGEEKFEKIEIDGEKFLSFSPENMLLYLCIHSAEHLWNSLSFSCDIERFIISHDLDWSVVIEKASLWGVERILLINILLTYQLLGLEIPPALGDRLKLDQSAYKVSKDIINRFLSEKSQFSFFQDAMLRIRIRESFLLGFKDFISENMIPPEDNLNRISLPNYLYNLYYILQPFQFLYKYITKGKM